MKLDSEHTLTMTTHPETSHAAAGCALIRSGSRRREVLDALAHAPSGLTDEETQSWLDMSPNTQRPRRIELVEMGYVDDSHERRRTRSNQLAIVWQVTALGMRALQS